MARPPTGTEKCHQATGARFFASKGSPGAAALGRLGPTAPENRPDQRRQLVANGTKEDPWVLKTAPGTSEYSMYRDEAADPPALVCQVGSTTLKYQLRALEDLHLWLMEKVDWVPLGAADENKPAADGSVEAWGRDPENPVGGWYGLRKGYRGRFGMYLPPLLEALGLVELTHDKRNNSVRAIIADASGPGTPA